MTAHHDDHQTALALMLSDARFPAPLWMLFAHAYSWGAPADYIEQLSHLPDTTYRRLTDVLNALNRRTT